MDEITIVFGQTEASPGCTMSSTHDPIEVRVGTVGCALPEIECRIVDPETGDEMPVGEIGEFVARGYNIMKGYYKMPRRTRSSPSRRRSAAHGDLAVKRGWELPITGAAQVIIIAGARKHSTKGDRGFLTRIPKVKDVVR
jgi:fatty-acyl-CoA synthase